MGVEGVEVLNKTEIFKELNIDYLTIELTEDINDYLNGWIDFVYFDLGLTEIAERENELLSKVKELLALVKRKEKRR